MILRITERDTVINVKTSSCKVPVIFIGFFDTFFKKAKILNLIKIRLVGAEFFHANGRKDGHVKANTRFSQFCESA